MSCPCFIVSCIYLIKQSVCLSVCTLLPRHNHICGLMRGKTLQGEPVSHHDMGKKQFDVWGGTTKEPMWMFDIDYIIQNNNSL